MAGFDERYEVSCSHCGVLAYEPFKRKALRMAQRQKVRHEFCEEILVYDRMAHVGRPEIFAADGTPRGIKLY